MDTPFLTEADVLNYLGIDYADKMVSANIALAISAADSYLTASLGEGFPRDDSRVKHLALAVVADLYDNRGITQNTTVSSVTRRLVSDFSMQIRTELLAAKNAAEGVDQ